MHLDKNIILHSSSKKKSKRKSPRSRIKLDVVKEYSDDDIENIH